MSLEKPVLGDIWDKHKQGDTIVIGTNLSGIHVCILFKVF